MNVILPKRYRVSKKDIIIYTISIIVCVVALTVVVTMQVLGEGVTNKFFHANKLEVATEEEKVKLRSDFENMFTNSYTNTNMENANNEKSGITKKEQDKDIVYTSYENEDNISGMYSLNVHIPNFNIVDESLESLNNKINTEYKQQVNEILNSKGSNMIYSVEYRAYIENQVLFLIIRSNLKQGNNAQQLMVKSYKYDLESKKQINLEEMITKLGYDKQDLQERINTDIGVQERNSKSLKELGYGIYVRNSKDEMYMVENSEQFFMYGGKLYIVYPYGNNSLTSEMDFIII